MKENFATGKIKCPICDKDMDIKIYFVYDRKIDGKGKKVEKQIEEMVLTKCPNCNNYILNGNPLLYVNKEREYAILYAEEFNIHKLEKGSIDLHKSVQNLKNFRLANDPTQLHEKIVILDYGLNDLVIRELKKDIAKKYRMYEEGKENYLVRILLEKYNKDNSLVFTLIPNKNQTTNDNKNIIEEKEKTVSIPFNVYLRKKEEIFSHPKQMEFEYINYLGINFFNI